VSPSRRKEYSVPVAWGIDVTGADDERAARILGDFERRLAAERQDFLGYPVALMVHYSSVSMQDLKGPRQLKRRL
jgi:hypothetical protein